MTISAVQTPTVKSTSDFYHHPNGYLLLGACEKRLQAIPNSTFDFLCTDAPYGVDYIDATNRSIKGDVDLHYLKPAFKEMYRVLKPNTYGVCFYGYTRIGEFMEAWTAAGFRIVGHLVFEKHYASNRRRSHTERRHENAYLLAKGRPAFPAQPFSDVQPWGRYTGNRLHPTQKPVEPFVRMIESYCPKGGRVLEPFCGSGTTLDAAIRAGCFFTGIELDPVHFDTAKQRLSAIEANLPKPIKRSQPLLRSRQPTPPIRRLVTA